MGAACWSGRPRAGALVEVGVERCRTIGPRGHMREPTGVPGRSDQALAVVARRRAKLGLLALAALLAGLVVGARAGEEPRFRTADASTFAAYGEPLACGGTLQPGERGVAHRTLPCGTKLVFRLNGRTVRAAVIDRGPYVAGREFDFIAATARELRFDGLGTVEWAREPE